MRRERFWQDQVLSQYEEGRVAGVWEGTPVIDQRISQFFKQLDNPTNNWIIQQTIG